MKKGALITLSALALCALAFTGTADGFKVGHIHVTYEYKLPVTLDGKWTTDNEWSNLPASFFGSSVFRDRFRLTSSLEVEQHVLIECLNDSTNDADDYVEMCFDCSQNGGSAPQTDDCKVNVMGHGANATVNWYKGTGNGWTPIVAFSNSSFEYASQLASSVNGNASHWIYEISLDRVAFALTAYLEIGLRVASYDANNTAFGVQAWPPTSPDVPNDWGDSPISFATPEDVPESLSLGVIVSLTSAVILVCTASFRRSILNKSREPRC
jgi:hypothetical protein